MEGVIMTLITGFAMSRDIPEMIQSLAVDSREIISLKNFTLLPSYLQQILFLLLNR